MGSAKRLTISNIRKQKESGNKIVMVTAYDALCAKIADEGGVDMLLVGDSLAMTVLGYRNTLPLTVEESIHHAKAVRRGAPNAFVVGDMPFMSFNISEADALQNASRYLKEADCDAIKLEGGATVAPLVARFVECGIPVMGHIGLLPQRVLTSGGYKVQGRGEDAAEQLIIDAKKLEDAGVFALVVECVPATLGARLAQELEIPVIGIGAGAGCDGQVQVLHDLLGLFDDFIPKHAKRYVDLGTPMGQALKDYVNDVRSGTFPEAKNSF